MIKGFVTDMYAQNINQIMDTAVLIVEDNEVVGKFFVETLTKAGAFPLLCKSGDEAKTFINHGEYPILIFDWNLPGMNGDELCRHTRSICQYHDSIILLITGHNEQGRLQEALLSGADDYITKPISAEILIIRLNILIAQRKDKCLRKKAEIDILKANETLENQIIKRTYELEQAHSMYKSIISNLSVGIAFLDKDLNILQLNPKMRELFSNDGNYIDTACFKALHSRTKPCISCPILECFSDRKIHKSCFEYDSANTKKWFSVIACPVINDNDEVVNVVEIIEDITEQVLKENELQRKLAEAEKRALAGRVSSLCDFSWAER